jgi:Mn-containing catalase
MATPNKTELHYLELLNTIASGERRAGIFLQAWADTTPDPELRACLSMVANRETSHYHIFKRRIAELGYSWTDTQDPDFEERLQVSGSDMPDAEKIRWGKARQSQRRGPTIRDRYEAAIADETVDPLTRSLLRWFSDVEADSGTRLRAVYDHIESKAG